jgi:hypothetical protein
MKRFGKFDQSKALCPSNQPHLQTADLTGHPAGHGSEAANGGGVAGADRGPACQRDVDPGLVPG